MEKNPIRMAEESPRTQRTWRVLGLAISAIVILPVLGILAYVMRSLTDPASVNPNRSIISESGFAGAVGSLLLAVSALMVGINAIRKGERSWMVWAGMALALLVGAFWIILIILQFGK